MIDLKMHEKFPRKRSVSLNLNWHNFRKSSKEIKKKNKFWVNDKDKKLRILKQKLWRDLIKKLKQEKTSKHDSDNLLMKDLT